MLYQQKRSVCYWTLYAIFKREPDFFGTNPWPTIVYDRGRCLYINRSLPISATSTKNFAPIAVGDCTMLNNYELEKYERKLGIRGDVTHYELTLTDASSDNQHAVYFDKQNLTLVNPDLQKRDRSPLQWLENALKAFALIKSVAFYNRLFIAHYCSDSYKFFGNAMFSSGTAHTRRLGGGENYAELRQGLSTAVRVGEDAQPLLTVDREAT